MRRSSWIPAFCVLATAFAPTGSGAQAGQAAFHPLEPSSSTEHLSCNAVSYAKLPNSRREAASAYFLYAMMSHNAYKDSAVPQYEIPGWNRTRRAYASSLAFDVYEREPATAKYDEIVVAYRGTATARYWKANLAIKEPAHYRRAFKFLQDSIRSKNRKSRITVTGHSLGGGIALNMALRLDSVNAVVFNTSPRAFFGEPNQKNKLVHVSETGEILEVTNGDYLSGRLRGYDYTRFKFDFLTPVKRYNAVAQHGIYPLSRGLLLTAVGNDDRMARDLFVRNVRLSASKDAKGAEKECKALYEAR
jgi:pimeloyl-ACP methyl ester carboxylesterase